MKYAHRVESRMRIEVYGCHAVPNSLRPRLVLAIKALNPFKKPLAMLGLEGGISVHDPKGGEKFLGPVYRISSSSPPYPMSVHTDTQDRLIVDLDWPMIEEIENIRHGGDIFLTSKVQFLCAEMSGAQVPQQMDRLFWIEAELSRNQNSQIKIDQGEWLAVLKSWGYADRRILEITMPALEKLREHMEDALKYLNDADKEIGEGNYPAALVTCRKAFESATPAIDAYVARLANGNGNNIREQKIVDFKKALKGILDIGAHPGASPTRSEACLGVSVFKQFLHHIST